MVVSACNDSRDNRIFRIPKNYIKVDKISSIDHDIFAVIIDYLTPKDAAIFSKTSRLFRKDVNHYYSSFIFKDTKCRLLCSRILGIFRKAKKSNVCIFICHPERRTGNISYDRKGVAFLQEKINREVPNYHLMSDQIREVTEDKGRGSLLYCPTQKRYKKIVTHLKDQLDKHPELRTDTEVTKFLVQCCLTFKQVETLLRDGNKYSREFIFLVLSRRNYEDYVGASKIEAKALAARPELKLSGIGGIAGSDPQELELLCARQDFSRDDVNRLKEDQVLNSYKEKVFKVLTKYKFLTPADVKNLIVAEKEIYSRKDLDYCQRRIIWRYRDFKLDVLLVRDLTEDEFRKLNNNVIWQALFLRSDLKISEILKIDNMLQLEFLAFTGEIRVRLSQIENLTDNELKNLFERYDREFKFTTKLAAGNFQCKAKQCTNPFF